MSSSLQTSPSRSSCSRGAQRSKGKPKASTECKQNSNWNRKCICQTSRTRRCGTCQLPLEGDSRRRPPAYHPPLAIMHPPQPDTPHAPPGATFSCITVALASTLHLPARASGSTGAGTRWGSRGGSRTIARCSP